MSARELYQRLYSANNKELEEKAKRVISNYCNIPKEYLDKIKVHYIKPPCEIIINRNNRTISLFSPLGFYSIERKEIYIDKNLPNDVKYLALLHEFLHAAQDYHGRFEKCDEECRKIVDIEASIATTLLFLNEFGYDISKIVIKRALAYACEMRKCSFLKRFLYYMLKNIYKLWYKK
jgi:Zn-dependent peptidase ImmA (M78 family)